MSEDLAKPVTEPRTTIVVTPRERFSVARKCLEEIFEHTPDAYELIYVDAGAPAEVAGWLADQAAERGFRYIRVDHYLSPNEARNLALEHITTDYAVFIENDMMVAPGWLEAFVQCADETGAAIVTPLICESEPLHQKVHFAGGSYTDDEDRFFATAHGERTLQDHMRHHHKMVEDVADELQREDVQAFESHCFLVRRDLFDKIGPFDARMIATRDHFDTSLSVREAGEKIVFEPAAVVTYLYPDSHNPLTEEDRAFFVLRWSPQWQRRSLQHFHDKWGLKVDGPVRRRLRNLGWRHDVGLVAPRVRRIPVIGRSRILVRAVRAGFAPVMEAIAARAVARDDKRRRSDARLH
ncbi:MAG: glycosyltransferase [Pseudomonadota bacterium]